MKVLLAIAASLALAGCATSGAAKKPTGTHRRADVDQEKMAQVEARAVGQGIDVIWVNPPTKKD
jgi:hypothetical protein